MDSPTENEKLKSQYSENQRRAESLKIELVSQISSIIDRESITLGVPLEHRVKSWESIEEKFDRKSINLSDIRELNDLIGIRIITLFEKDAERFEDIFRKDFDVIEFEYTGSKLADSQFGYQSRHFVAKIKSEWENLPTLKGMTDFKFEVQVRTLAQHIWAAASHKLQYKREDAVPQGLKRSIHRISALLETVDLELARLQHERETYDQQARNIGRVDKRDSQSRRLLIQDCFLRSSHGSRGFVGRGVGTDRAAAAARARSLGAACGR